MRKEYLESDEPKLVHEEKPFASALSLDDLQGVFYLSGLLICVGILAFIFELLFHRMFSENDRKFIGDNCKSYNGDNTKIINVKEHKMFY